MVHRAGAGLNVSVMLLRRASRNMLMVQDGFMMLVRIAAFPLAIIHGDWRYAAVGAALVALALAGLYWLRRVDIVEDWEDGFDEYKRQHEESQE